MAAYSNHPASAPPAAPVRETTGHLMLRGWCIFVLFMALKGINRLKKPAVPAPGAPPPPPPREEVLLEEIRDLLKRQAPR